VNTLLDKISKKVCDSNGSSSPFGPLCGEECGRSNIYNSGDQPRHLPGRGHPEDRCFNWDARVESQQCSSGEPAQPSSGHPCCHRRKLEGGRVRFPQLFDDSLHRTCSEDCEYLPHSKDARRKYHVYGEAVLASRESKFEMFWACLPLLQMAKGRRTIILAPLPRYLFSRCCKTTPTWSD
jgi:hypothetical protein